MSVHWSSHAQLSYQAAYDTSCQGSLAGTSPRQKPMNNEDPLPPVFHDGNKYYRLVIIMRTTRWRQQRWRAARQKSGHGRAGCQKAAEARIGTEEKENKKKDEKWVEIGNGRWGEP